MIYGLWGQQNAEEQERSINVSAGEINWLTDAWTKRWNRPPTDEDINQYLQKMVLYREEVAIGLVLPRQVEFGIHHAGTDQPC